MARNKRRALDLEIQVDFPHLIEHVEEILQLAQKYAAYKRERRGLLDYDDLLDQAWSSCLQQPCRGPQAPFRQLSLHND